MDQVFEFFELIFHTCDWPPRWECGQWSDFHGWLYIFSDTAIWLAYFIIPVILLRFISSKPSIPFLPIFWLFTAFILLCGLTHLMDAIIFWWPAYRISAILRFLTAIVSLATVFTLTKDIPKLLSLNTKKDMHDKEIGREQLIIELEKEIERLSKKIN